MSAPSPGPAVPDAEPSPETSSGVGTLRLAGRDVPLIRFTGPLADVPTVATRLAEAGLAVGRRPVVVLVGGADGLRIGDPPAWAALFRDGLLAGLLRSGACLVDGGTDTGVFALAGTARAAAGAVFPAVGVVAEGTVRWPGHQPDTETATVGPQHTHLVVVPGQTWGTESPWISLIASALAGGTASITVVVNGGPITLHDVRRSLAAGRPTLIVAGTGRLADAIVSARRGAGGASAAERELAASPLIQVVDGLRAPSSLADAISCALDRRA
jgi:hypothetical protein